MTSHPPSSRAWLLPYTLLYGALACLMALLLWHVCSGSIFVPESLDLPPPPTHSPDRLLGRIDPNTADWHDLSLLPDLGAAVAQRIIAHRQAHQLAWQQSHPDQPPEQAPPAFTAPEDLLPIKGIGPKTLEKMRPYLHFLTTQPTQQQ